MSYKNPKIDWKASDVVLNEDFNRIEGNVDYLKVNTVPITTSILAGTGLTGGGTLDNNRTLSADFGVGGTQIARGNHTHSEYAPSSVSISAGTGLTGGGTIASSRTISANFGTSSTQVARGNHTHSEYAKASFGHGMESIFVRGENDTVNRTISIGTHNHILIKYRDNAYILSSSDSSNALDLLRNRFQVVPISSITMSEAHYPYVSISNYTNTSLSLRATSSGRKNDATAEVHWYVF